MSNSTPLPEDHPMRAAFATYEESGNFKNDRRWAAHDAHVDGALWSAFCAGYEAANKEATRHDD